MRAQIHPSSNISGDVELADDVIIGPSCTLIGPITIGAGTRLMGHNYFTGRLTIGTNNLIYPFACLGLEPQDLKFDPAAPCAGLVIGNDNVLREHTTIHRATSAERPTSIGNNNYFMYIADLGHDCTVGNNCVFVNKVSVGGHSVIEDLVTLGGAANVAQHTCVGRMAFVGGLAGYSLNIPPFMITRSRNAVYGVNVIGMRRAGYSRTEIDHLRWAFRIIFRERNARPAILDTLAERADLSPAIRELHAFLERPNTPICRYDSSSTNATSVREDA